MCVRPRRPRVHAVNGLTYELRAGRMLAIIGESGSGKTVSSRALMGLLPATATIDRVGPVSTAWSWSACPRSEMRRHRGADIAMVFQDPTRSLNPTMSIGAQITEAIRAHEPVDPRRPSSARSNCCRWSGSRRRTGASTSIRTSSPAACGNGS